MEFKNSIKSLAERVDKLKEQIQTEEATKNALIMPFLQVIGYDVFNPGEIVPEFTADIGIKKGEKVDYAILKDNSPVILIECKHWNQALEIKKEGQLLRYFNVTKARFGILTNGITYKFYSDLVQPNIMDEKPFFEFDITDIGDNSIEELRKFHKNKFVVTDILATAAELKYTGELKALIYNEFDNPSEGFVKHFTKQVYQGVITSKVLEQFTALTKKSINHVISEIITNRFKAAMTGESVAKNIENIVDEPDENKIITTAEEIECFFLIKSILRKSIDPDRITFKDAVNYFTVILDDKITKPICRLYLNKSKKYIGLIDESKKETKYEIVDFDHIYNYSDQIIKTATGYENK